jgi:pyruvate dehydrogenase complex dehydrogenase (E1) component
VALGVDQYGQSGSRQDLYNYYQIGLKSMVQAIVEAIG